MLAAVWVLLATAALNGTPRTQQVAAMTVALVHAHSTFELKPILVATDTLKERILPPPEPGALRADPSRIREAARAAGFAEGTSQDALICEPNGACRVAGVYRGMIRILDYREVDSNTLVVTLQMMEWQVHRGFAVGMHIRFNEVHVVRTSRDTAWRIDKVISLQPVMSPLRRPLNDS